MQYEDFLAIQGTGSPRDRHAQGAARRLRTEMETSVNYVGPRCKEKAYRNGQEQGFTVTQSDAQYKYAISALPGEDLFVGDIIECYNEHWIVVESRDANPICRTGLMWQCNLLLRFQNWNNTVHERYCVLDSGVYSTTLTGTAHIRTTDKRFKAYLQLDEETENLFIDKRIASGLMPNASGDKVLTCYRITGRDEESRSYGNGAHLLVLNLRSDEYVPGTDNPEERICDWREP